MDIFAVLSLFVWYAIATLILVVIALMIARLILNKADFNPFSRPVIMIRRWTDPLVYPVRAPLAQLGFSPNVAPLVVVLIVIRIVFSWGQVSQVNRVMRFLVSVTDPLLMPLRHMIPPLGMFDISPIVAFIIIWLFQTAIAVTLLRGWPLAFFK